MLCRDCFGDEALCRVVPAVCDLGFEFCAYCGRQFGTAQFAEPGSDQLVKIYGVFIHHIDI